VIEKGTTSAILSRTLGRGFIKVSCVVYFSIKNATLAVPVDITLKRLL
jgi:hypothetical protein